jgi:C4-dicarboxylate-specific signal transduction histidine kinase
MSIPPTYRAKVDALLAAERRRAEEALANCQAALAKAQADLAHVTRVSMMGELAASIAHEVNQPISGVVLNGNACMRWLSRVAEDSVHVAEAREALQRIVRDGTRAGEIVARIRSLCSNVRQAKVSLDMNEVIREASVLTRMELCRKRVTLRLDLADDLPPVHGDKVQLQQVLLNLMLNAIQAMSAIERRPRELTVTTCATGSGEVLVTVHDCGVGFDCDCIEKLFTAFHTTKPGGMGMGLSISRSIVEDHAGRLWATANEDFGATFQFTLPSNSRCRCV